MRKFSDPIMWTHLLFVVNAFLYAFSDYGHIAILLFLNTIASTFYHRSREKDKAWQGVDMFFCWITVLAILFTVYSLCSRVEITVLLLWLFGSLIVWHEGDKHYEVLHAIWHFLVFGGNLIAWSFLP